MAAPQITIVQLDPEVPLDRFSGWLHGAILRNLPAYRQPLPAVDRLGDGVIVLGSRSRVADARLWMEPLRRLMVQAVDRGLPLLGICLGHQLLAQAFGGEVQVADPGGGYHGPVEVRWLPAADADAVLGRVANLPGTLFPASHHDVVTHLPNGAVELARSPAYANQAFRVGSAVGVQFHPEASPELMTAWAGRRGGNTIRMRRSMRRIDDRVARNGTLIAQDFAQAAREYAESAGTGVRRVA